MKIAIDILEKEVKTIRRHIDYLKDMGYFRTARQNKKNLIEIKKAISRLEKHK